MYILGFTDPTAGHALIWPMQCSALRFGAPTATNGTRIAHETVENTRICLSLYGVRPEQGTVPNERK